MLCFGKEPLYGRKVSVYERKVAFHAAWLDVLLVELHSVCVIRAACVKKKYKLQAASGGM